MSDIQITQKEKIYKRWTVVLSVLIPLAVALLFGIKIPMNLPVFLPPIYAGINAVTAVFLIIAVWAVKNGRLLLHERFIKMAMIFSLLFLVMYVLYHITSDTTAYGGKGLMRSVYFFVLISHILLSIAVIPFVLVTYTRAILKKFPLHRKIAKYTFPLWLYVAISGVVVYFMISPYYVL